MVFLLLGPLHLAARLTSVRLRPHDQTCDVRSGETAGKVTYKLGLYSYRIAINLQQIHRCHILLQLYILSSLGHQHKSLFIDLCSTRSKVPRTKFGRVDAALAARLTFVTSNAKNRRVRREPYGTENGYSFPNPCLLKVNKKNFVAIFLS